MSGCVLVLDQYSQLGGAQRCLLQLLPAFAEAGIAVHVAVPERGALAEGARNAGATVHEIACGPYTSRKKSW